MATFYGNMINQLPGELQGTNQYSADQIRSFADANYNDPFNNPGIQWLVNQGLIRPSNDADELSQRATYYGLTQLLGMPESEANAAMAAVYPTGADEDLEQLAALYEQSMLGGVPTSQLQEAAANVGLYEADPFSIERVLESRGFQFGEQGSGELERGYPSALAIVEAGQQIADSGVGNMIFTPEYDALGSDTNRYELAQGIVNAEDEAAKLAARTLANTQQTSMNAAAKASAEGKAQSVQNEIAAKLRMLQPRNRQFQIEAPRGFVGEAETVGAASDEPMGAGNASYKSELIKSLRNANENPFSSNKGVTLRPNRENSGLTLDFNRAAPGPLTNAGANKPTDTKPDNTVVTKLPGDESGGGGAGSGGGNFIGGGGSGGSGWIGDETVIDDSSSDGGVDSWSEWNDWSDTGGGDDLVDSWSEWGDWGGEEEDLQNMLDAPDAFKDVFDFGLGFGGGGGGKSTDDMLTEMLQA